MNNEIKIKQLTSKDYKAFRSLATLDAFDDWFKQYELEALNSDEYKETMKHNKTMIYGAIKSTWQDIQKEVKQDFFNNKAWYVDSDGACIKLMQENGSAVMLDTGSDGSSMVAVYDKEEINMIPKSFKPAPVRLSGTYKIMTYDCSKSFNDAGDLISGHYIEIYNDEAYNYIFIIY